MQVAELQEAVAAESQRRKEAEQQVAAAAQKAAEVAATKHALSEELAAEKNKVLSSWSIPCRKPSCRKNPDGMFKETIRGACL